MSRFQTVIITFSELLVTAAFSLNLHFEHYPQIFN